MPCNKRVIGSLPHLSDVLLKIYDAYILLIGYQPRDPELDGNDKSGN